MEGGSLVIGGNLALSLEMENTELVNQPEEDEVYWARLALLAVTLVVNTAAVVVLWRKEDNPINRLIIWDCIINLLTMFSTVVPFTKLNNAYLCSIWLSCNATLSLWNRLVPVGIAVFRFMLVCIVVKYCVCK
jgi:hypothetical protein